MPAKKRTVTPDKVIAEAVALCDEEGWDAVTLAAVAGQLGIRIPSLYNHVDGLPGLRQQMGLWGVRQLNKDLRRATVGKAGEDAIFSMAHAYRAFAEAHPGLYRATLRAPGPDEPELEAASIDVIDLCFTVLAHYHLSTADTLHTVRILRSLMHGFVDLEASGGFGLALDRDETFRRLIAAFVNGIEALPQEELAHEQESA